MHPHPTQTSATLLQEVRDGGNAAAWARFEGRYREMLVRFCRSLGVQHADAEDIVQGVFTKLLTGLRNFEYDPSKGRFRDYLFRCARSAVSDWAARPKGGRSAVGTLEGLSAPDSDAAGAAFEREWMNHHYRLALAEVRRHVDPQSLSVLEETLAGREVTQIAGSLGMSEGAVYKVQQRMRRYLREQIGRQVREEDAVHG